MVDISSEVIANTVSQITYDQDVAEQVIPQPQGNSELQQQSVPTNSDPVSVMLKTLEGMAKKFDNFEKQAQVDRDRVERLCEQFKNDSGKKAKTPKKNVNKTTDNIVNPVDINDAVLSSYRDMGARPRTLQPKQMQSTTSVAATTSQPVLLTYEQFLSIHQAQSTNQDRSQRSGSSRAVNPNVSGVSSSFDKDFAVFRAAEGDGRGQSDQARARPTSGRREDAATEMRQPQMDCNSLLHSTTAAVPEERDSDEEDFPSLQTLNKSAVIQERVNARYQDLEKATAQQGTFENFVEMINKNSDKKS